MTVLAALAAASSFAPSPARAAPVRVVHSEGLAHGYLALRALDGSPLAEGDLFQHAEGDRVTARLRFQFKDGSLREETTVYTQRGHFRFVSNHVVQKGPAFKTQLESTIDSGGHVKVRYSEGGGEEKKPAPPPLGPRKIADIPKELVKPPAKRAYSSNQQSSMFSGRSGAGGFGGGASRGPAPARAGSRASSVIAPRTRPDAGGAAGLREAAFFAGQKVRHGTFGDGIVVSSKLVENDEEVTVAFAGKGVKRLLASFAKLEKAE
jgi:hypothetical protein